jgi:hypothetical protein
MLNLYGANNTIVKCIERGIGNHGDLPEALWAIEKIMQTTISCFNFWTGLNFPIKIF